MKRSTLWETYDEYCKHWNVMQCVGDHPRTVRLREEREKKLQRVKELLDITENYESAKEFLDTLEFAKTIINEALENEKFD